MEAEQKPVPVMIVGVDDSEHSFYALEWTLDHFLTPSAPNSPFKLIVVHSKPSPTSAIGFAGPGESINLTLDTTTFLCLGIGC